MYRFSDLIFIEIIVSLYLKLFVYVYIYDNELLSEISSIRVAPLKLSYHLFSLMLKDLEIENEDLKERLRKIQQEQRILLDKVNGLQLQLNEVNNLHDTKNIQNYFTVSHHHCQ